MTIESAKHRIMNSYPFFGSLLYTLPVEYTDELPTLAVDGERLYVNQKYWDSLQPPEQMGVLMHEVGHLFLDHPRRGEKYKEMVDDPATGQAIRLYNLAGDCVINLMITENGGTLPKNVYMDRKYTGWATEDVYYDLLKTIPKMSPQQMQQFMKNAKAQGWCDQSRFGKNPDGTPKSKDQMGDEAQKWKHRGHAAAEYARMKGKEPGWLKRMFNIMEPKEDWRHVLVEYAQPFNDDYSFNPADRRFLEADFSLPDIQDGEKIDWIAIAIDTSGSIGGKEIDAFVSEVKGIMDSFARVRVKVTFCDADATPFQELDDFDPSKLNVKGGGGTNFRPVFKLLEKEDTPPKALLYFTDGYGDYPSKMPDGYDVMWILTTKYEVPWGRPLDYRI